MDYTKRTWAEIDLDALIYNIQNVEKIAGKPIMAVVKANAYGHGDVAVAKELLSYGIKSFAVSNIDEAVHLRNNGISGDILILGYTPIQNLGLVCKYDIFHTVTSVDSAKQASDFALQNGSKIKVFIKFDTGMGRIGLRADADDIKEQVQSVCGLDGIEVCGAFTHFAVADSTNEDDIAYTKKQQKLFESAVSYINKKDIIVCSQNSAGSVFYSGFSGDIVREGIIMYGQKPDSSLEMPFRLRPVMSLKSVVSHIKTIHKGDSVSYGRTFVADRDTIVATVPIGYADGYHRALSNKADMLVLGQRAKIIGRVCMDQVMLDITDIDGVSVGDTVTVFGKDGENEITLDELAELAGTISYELLCAVGIRVPRVYKKNGKEIKMENYINQEAL